MSTEAEHIALANRNQGVLDLLLQYPTISAEWVAVVAFYKALHVVEAIFSRDQRISHTHNHHVRLETLKNERRYQLLFPPYRALWTAGLVARYLEAQIPAGTGSVQRFSRFDDYLPAANLRPDLLDRFLHPFEGLAFQLLSPSGGGLVRYTPLPPPQPPSP